MSQFIMAGMLPRFTMPSGQAGGGGGSGGAPVFIGGTTIPPDVYSEMQVGRSNDLQAHIGKKAMVLASIFAMTVELPTAVTVQESVDDVIWTDLAFDGGVTLPIIQTNDKQITATFPITKRYARAIINTAAVANDIKVCVNIGVLV